MGAEYQSSSGIERGAVHPARYRRQLCELARRWGHLSVLGPACEICLVVQGMFIHDVADGSTIMF